MTAELWGPVEWFLYLAGALIVLVLADLIGRKLEDRHGRRRQRCALCRRSSARPGDVMCWECSSHFRTTPTNVHQTNGGLESRLRGGK